jgi:hypothetical protein
MELQQRLRKPLLLHIHTLHQMIAAEVKRTAAALGWDSCLQRQHATNFD